MPGWSDLDFEAYAARHQQAYWLKVDLPHKIQHAKLLNMTEVEMPAPITDIATSIPRGVTEFTVIAPDHPRLLSIDRGRLCRLRRQYRRCADVHHDRRIGARHDLHISRAFDFDEDELRRANKIALAIERSLLGEIRLQDMIAGRRDQRQERGKTFQVPARVNIDNNLSKRFTVVEVSRGSTGPACSSICTTIFELKLNIGSAHIITFGEKAVDVFYVTDLAGAKITSASHKSSIKRRILEKIPTP